MFHLYNLVCDRRNLIITSPRGRSNPATPTRLYRGRDGKTTPTRLYQAREGIFIKRCSSGNEGRINTRRIWTRSGRRWNLWIKEYLEYNPGRYKQILKNESSAGCGAAQRPSRLCSKTTCLKASTKRILKIDFALLLRKYTPYKRLIGLKWFLKKYLQYCTLMTQLLV